MAVITHPAWSSPPSCAEFRAMGLELELIELDRRRRDLSPLSAEAPTLDAEMASVRAELEAVSFAA